MNSILYNTIIQWCHFSLKEDKSLTNKNKPLALLVGTY